MKDLTNTTFISAVKIESKDRLENAKSVLGYLNHHFRSNVFIYEMSEGESKLDFVKDFKNLKVKVLLDNFSKVFHRTRFLNLLLKHVSTQVVCNYDIDVILPVSSYIEAEKNLIKGENDVIYPFPDGLGQICVPQSFSRQNFNISFGIEDINICEELALEKSLFGHAVFLKTELYKKIGGENENFISYGPEDQERATRFMKYGLNVGRFENEMVYHFEHYRGNDSGKDNPFYPSNVEEIKKIEGMDIENLKKYLPEL